MAFYRPLVVDPLKKIAKVGRFAFYERAVVLEPLEEETDESIEVQQQPPLLLERGLVGTRSASQLTGFSPRTIRKWCKDKVIGKLINARKDGKFWLLNLELLSQYIKDNKLSPKN